MSLFNLKNIRNHPSRSAFDLSTKVAFSAKVGELLPIRWYWTMPGDKFTLKHQHFTRTQPVNTSAYTRIREYYDWFYVPLHLLWRNAPEIITQMQKNVQHASSSYGSVNLGDYLPTISNSWIDQSLVWITGNNYFGYNRKDLAYKLIQYLRYGNSNATSASLGTSRSFSSDYTQRYKFNLNLSIFPLLAYKKFCQDYYRYTQWQDSSPYLFNIDYYDGRTQSISFPSSTDSYWSGNTLFDLEYCNWNKDIFMGVLPDTQYGDVSSINMSGDVSQVYNLFVNPGAAGSTEVTLGASVTGGRLIQATDGDVAINDPMGIVLPASSQSSFNILQLRRAEALQRWKEISLNNSQNYRSQIKAHFGVDVGEFMSGMSTYIGGSSSNLDISEVVNTNLQQNFGGENFDSSAVIGGKGVGSSQSFEKFTAPDWGILMCIYHSVPLLDYVSTAPDPQLFVSSNTDLPIPELDSIGMQSLPVVNLSNSPLELTASNFFPSTTIGYLPRYYNFKTSYDYVLGAFTTTELEWVAPITSQIWQKMLSSLNGALGTINYNFFKVNPSVLDPIFQVKADSKWDTDQFLINCALDVKVVRNLDYSGMPY